MQTRRHSAIESITNVAVGYLVALASQIIENLPAQPGRHGNLLTEPSPGKTGGGNEGTQ